MKAVRVTVAGSPHPSLPPKAGRSKKKRISSFPRWGKVGMGAVPAFCPIPKPGQYAE
jgi:hypothetical protein